VHIYFLCHTEVQENSQSCCLLLLCRCSKPTELLAECVPLCRSQSTAWWFPSDSSSQLDSVVL
jgi:hypothetical protein